MLKYHHGPSWPPHFHDFHILTDSLEQAKLTAVHQGFSKYMTAQDTHISPASTNHHTTLSSHANLLSLQSQSTIQ